MARPILTHFDGKQTRLVMKEQLEELLAELDRHAGIDHGAVSVTVDDGWCVAVHLDGSVLFENLEELDDEPSRWMRDVKREEQLKLLGMLVELEIDQIAELGWEAEQ